MTNKYLSRTVTINAKSMCRLVMDTAHDVTDTDNCELGDRMTVNTAGHVLQYALVYSMFGPNPGDHAITIRGEDFASIGQRALRESFGVLDTAADEFGMLMPDDYDLENVNVSLMGHVALLLLAVEDKLFGRDVDANE